ncbi:hypothetical protein C9I98_05710 [Photobacterium sanctipauli]|uniref:Uncharacterized protein n=1 Tax=Photobacterium sanctipauli TaxID=1342794 RepID=A0A2T3NYY2_9GAMM|nr:hypothetical protein [Photobacterium sanctipauli]PSW21428.1 hypothetical protein C9I98_05710 [Photobacterium sanctipauli]
MTVIQDNSHDLIKSVQVYLREFNRDLHDVKVTAARFSPCGSDIIAQYNIQRMVKVTNPFGEVVSQKTINQPESVAIPVQDFQLALLVHLTAMLHKF